MITYKDFPFSEVVAKAEELCRQGHRVHQKYTCVGCGSRLTIEEPCKFYKEGNCDKCDAITNIEKQGCNYMVHMRLK